MLHVHCRGSAWPGNLERHGKDLLRYQKLDQWSRVVAHSAHSCHDHLAPTGPTTSTTCSAYHTLRLTRLASKFVFIHPRLPSDRPFPLHGLVSPLVLPQKLSGRSHADRPSTDATSPPRLEKPVVPRRTRPFAIRASVWTISLLGKNFTVYRHNQVSFRSFLSPFAFELPA